MPERERGTMQRALQHLARRAYARAEVATRLRAEGHEASSIVNCLDRLEAWGTLNDGRLAAAEAAATARQGRGPRWLRQRLLKRGIAAAPACPGAEACREGDAHASAPASADLGPAAEAEAARRLARRVPLDDTRAERRRRAAWLARRGFDPAAIRRILDLLRADGAKGPQPEMREKMRSTST